MPSCICSLDHQNIHPLLKRFLRGLDSSYLDKYPDIPVGNLLGGPNGLYDRKMISVGPREG
jgi:hypothetical protein